MKVGVIGGGIGGLYTALKIVRYSDVELFEEHNVIGYPKHCTGLISSKVFNLLGSGTRDYVLNKFNAYTLIHGLRPSKHLELRFNNYVYLVDRPALEKYLSEEFQKGGGILHLGMKVTSVRPSEALVVANNIVKHRYDMVINAEGAKAYFSKMCNLCLETNYLLGLQAIIKCKNDLDNPYIIFSDDISREFFSWLVPVNDNYVIAGVADNSREVYVKLRYVIKKYLIRRYGSGDDSFKEIFGGLIPTSTPCKQVIGRLVGVGDAVSVTKPLSGGGIYAIVNQADALEKSFKYNSSVDEIVRRYERNVLRLITNLKIQHILRKLIVVRFNTVSEFVRHVIDSGISEITLADYDTYMIDISKISNNFKLIKMLVLNFMLGVL